MISQTDFSLAFILILSLLLVLARTEDKLCHRILFSFPSEQTFPYYGLEGVYIRQPQVVDYVPVFEREQGGLFFLYSARAKKVFFSRSKSTKDYIGVSATVKYSSVTRDWINKVRNYMEPFTQVISTWLWYDPIIKKHRQVKYSSSIKAVCVPEFTFRCTSGMLFFNTSFVDGTKILHDMKNDYFTQIRTLYTNNRPVYRHSRKSDWLLFYAEGHWLVGPNYRNAYGSIKVTTTARRPEYVRKNWQFYNSGTRRWEDFSNPVGIRCKGAKPSPGEDACSTVRSPCPSGTGCYKNVLNETVCKCGPTKVGPYCTVSVGKCSKYQLNGKLEAMAVTDWGYESSFLTIFCAAGKQPTYITGTCVKDARFSKYSWVKSGTCMEKTVPTKHTYPTKRGGGVIAPKKAKPFSADKYLWIRPTVLTLAILTQILVPSFFLFCDRFTGKYFRTLSLYLFLSMLLWTIYILGCYGSKCGAHGAIFGDLLIFAFVMLVVGYLFNVIETCYSTEKEYVSTVVQDASLRQYLDELKNSGVEVTGQVECYHMETRVRTVYYTDANGNTQTRLETYQEMVVTYTESQVFEYKFCRDVSYPDVPMLSPNQVTRLKITKDITGGDEETRRALINFQTDLVERNRHRDVHIVYHQHEEIPNFKEHVCAFLDRVEKPFWMNLAFYWLATILCLTWPYRWFFQFRTGKSAYTIKKEIYLEEPPPHATAPSEYDQLPPTAFTRQPVSNCSNGNASGFGLYNQETTFMVPLEAPPSYDTAIREGPPVSYSNSTVPFAR